MFTTTVLSLTNFVLNHPYINFLPGGLQLWSYVIVIRVLRQFPFIIWK